MSVAGRRSCRPPVRFMHQDDDSYLADILESAAYIAEFVTGRGRDALEERLIFNAVVREIEIIGEASRNLSEQFRAAHPLVPWRDIIGMRNMSRMAIETSMRMLCGMSRPLTFPTSSAN